MPDMKHATEEELILHYYGETIDSRPLASHVETCTQCRAALQELTEVLALVDAQVAPEPLAGLEERVWARVQPEVSGRGTTWWSRALAATPQWAVACGAAVILVAGFLAGRFTQPQPAAPAHQDIVVADSAVAAERVMTVAVGDHLDLSQMVLLELLNGVTDRASLEDEQERARELVAANRLYRHTAFHAGDEGVREVLDALERVLIEIANAPPDVSARELESLRAEIEQRGILFRLRVVSSEMRAREQNVMGPSPTGP